MCTVFLHNTLNLLSLKSRSLSRSLSLSTRISRSNPRAAMMRPLPMRRVPPRRRDSFSLFSRGLMGRRVRAAGATWQPPPKLRRWGLRTTSKSSSLIRSRGSRIAAQKKTTFKYGAFFKTHCLELNLTIVSVHEITSNSTFQGRSILSIVSLVSLHW